MLRKLGKGITIINVAAFTVVILVGGISIYLTKDILHNTYKIEEISEDILTIDSIHSDTYQLIQNIHHFLLEEDDLSSQAALELISKLRMKIENYRAHELKEETGSEKPEIEQLDTMLGDINKLENDDKLVELEEYSYEI
jgi:uncharacterized protein involved in exopolysaccharide biosynthesis